MYGNNCYTSDLRVYPLGKEIVDKPLKPIW